MPHDPMPKVSAARGAPLGRWTPGLAAEGLAAPVDAGRWTLRRVRLCAGGYDKGGAYWGLGAPLWYARAPVEPRTPDQLTPQAFFRARDRAAAIAHVRAVHKGARFYVGAEDYGAGALGHAAVPDGHPLAGVTGTVVRATANSLRLRLPGGRRITIPLNQLGDDA